MNYSYSSLSIKKFDQVQTTMPEESIDELLNDKDWKELMKQAKQAHHLLTKWENTPHNNH